MTDRNVTNLAASIRQRLQNAARSSGRPFQEVAQYYAMERFLYRLSVSKHADKFVLKGALMLTAWGLAATRPTRDIDLLGRLPNRVEELVGIVRDVCGQKAEPDGLTFDGSSVAGVLIKEDADYEGVRVTFRGHLDNMRLPMQIDVGFGDVVSPEAELIGYPTILDLPAPQLRGYTRETVVAEKFEAMVKLGLLNSRMKDFYDIWLLSRQFAFEGAALATALEQTFANRGTAIPAEPTALSLVFATDPAKAAQWGAFLNRSRLSDAPNDLSVLVAANAEFLVAPVAAVRERRPFRDSWRAAGPWTSGRE